MGEALLLGLLRAGSDPASLAVVEVVEARRIELSTHGVAVASSLDALEHHPLEDDALERRDPTGKSEVEGRQAGSNPSGRAVVIAVKPHDVAAACLAIRRFGAERVLSIAAGVTTGSLESGLGARVAVVRAMPNTAALVGRGAAAIAPGAGAGPADVAWAANILRSVGTVEVVEEALLDAVTGLTGSGPAYLFLVAEALIDAGVAVGLSKPMAEAMVTQLFLGSAALLASGTGTPEQLRAQVTSPGGTTAAGIAVLEAAGVRGDIVAAVRAATDRSRELAQS
jgi:pyrroline-5-carboxylate reductase